MTLEELRDKWNNDGGAKPKRHLRDDEHRIQCACVRLFRYLYPNYLIYAIPNGGQRNAIVAAKLKAEGVQAGIPDLHIPVAKGGYHSLYVEMKNGKKGRLSDLQKEMITRLESLGHKVVVCHSVDEFQREVEEYIKQN